MKKLNIQNDLVSRAEIARRSNEPAIIKKESDVKSLNHEEYAQSQDVQKCENHILTQTGVVKKKTQRGRKAKRDTEEVPI